jgi:hypothetical protein
MTWRLGRSTRWGSIVATFLLLSPEVLGSEPDDFDGYGVTLTKERYRGREAIRVLETRSAAVNVDRLAVLRDVIFRNGTIEVWLAGEPTDVAVAAQGARGFVGVAFRVEKSPSRYEAIYLRPTNARAEDQLRRNHSTQYISHPEFPWERLRAEAPGSYESYSDMAPGEWIHCRIVVSGTHAQLFLGSASQPSLVVNDLKHGDVSGKVALWIGPGTVAHFAELRIIPAVNSRTFE